MKEQYSDRDSKFIEKQGRLLFLAFIKPIINGVGFDFKEAEISQKNCLSNYFERQLYKFFEIIS